MEPEIRKPREKGKFRRYCERHSFRPGFVKLFVLLALIALVLPVLTGITTSSIIKSRTTEFGLKNIGELATQAGYYTNVQVISGSREILGIAIPLTEKKYIFGYDGVIKAGYDFSEIGIRVDELTHTIHVQLPEARILSNEIDEDSFELFDENRNIFNSLKMEDINASIAALKEESEKNAVQNGILENARSNAENLIRSFLAGTYDLTSYQVVFD